MSEEASDRRRKAGVDRAAVRAAGAFALVGVAWIVVSDTALDALLQDSSALAARIARGVVLILAASVVVFLLVRRFGRQWERAQDRAREAADALRRSESRYRSLVERVPGVVWLNEVDAEDPALTHCIYVAPQLQALLGYSPEEWMADDHLWRGVIHPDDREEVQHRNERADDTGTLSMEYRALRRDGSMVWIHDEAVLIPAGDGRQATWQGIMVDITEQRERDHALRELLEERQRVEVALRTAEAKYRSLVEEGPAIVYLHDADRIPARVTYIGPQIVDLLGHPAASWTGDPTFWLQVVHPADRERLTRADRAAIERQQSLDVEYRMVAQDGREVWVQDRARLVRGPDGEPLVYQGVLVDVTSRHRAEDERRSAIDRQLRLATRLELLHVIDREVLSSSPIERIASRALEHLRLLVPFDRGVVATIAPETGRFEYAALHSPDLSLDTDLRMEVPDELSREWLARDLFVVPDLEELDPLPPLAAAALRAGIRSALSVALESDDGQVGVLVLAAREPHAFDDEAADIAKEVASEIAIAIAQVRLRQALAGRVEELGRLAEERQQMLHRIVRAQEEERERVALELHDGLGQILTSISLFASDLAEEVGEEYRPRATRVNDLVRRAIADSRQLVWSLRPPELERLGLVPALRRLADDTSSPDLTVDLLEEIGDVRLAPESEAVVYRVVQEAVHNAQKHAAASAISILLQRHDGQLTTLVEDNGRGFDPALIPAGRGLGLIGMRERAELVDGALVVESANQAGTRVRLLVPIGATPNGAEGGAGA